MDALVLKASLKRWVDALAASAPELNELDGQLGDGDLGATLEKCAQNVLAALPSMPDTLEGVFNASAQACARASGSSFGTLLAVAFLGASKWVPPRQSLDRASTVELLNQTVQALSARGGASIGDKTVLDSLHAIAAALAGADDRDDLVAVARRAAVQALQDFRGKPSRIGRARMFAERSAGMDDPGMVAMLRMTESL